MDGQMTGTMNIAVAGLGCVGMVNAVLLPRIVALPLWIWRRQVSRTDRSIFGPAGAAHGQGAGRGWIEPAHLSRPVDLSLDDLLGLRATG